MIGENETYYTLRIPFAPFKFATQWHPTESTGPFKVLTRGAFKTIELAMDWGKANLNGTPYNVIEVDMSEVDDGRREISGLLFADAA